MREIKGREMHRVKRDKRCHRTVLCMRNDNSLLPFVEWIDVCIIFETQREISGNAISLAVVCGYMKMWSDVNIICSLCIAAINLAAEQSVPIKSYWSFMLTG